MYRPDIPSLQNCHEGHEKLHIGEEKNVDRKVPLLTGRKPLVLTKKSAYYRLLVL